MDQSRRIGPALGVTVARLSLRLRDPAQTTVQVCTGRVPSFGFDGQHAQAGDMETLSLTELSAGARSLGNWRPYP